MSQLLPTIPPLPAWFCLKSQPKHEHIAALHLKRRIEEIDVFCPRLRIRKNTRRGAVWFVEPLFPGYLFAQFNPANSIQLVKSTPGVSTIVSFGLFTPVIQDEIIQELRADFDQNELHEVNNQPLPGDCVTIAVGPFQGLKAEIIRVLPGPQRVQVLMEILGRPTPVEVGNDEIVGAKPLPSFLSKSKTVPVKCEATPWQNNGEAPSPIASKGPTRADRDVAMGQQMSR